jgi:hypothetical protein
MELVEARRKEAGAVRGAKEQRLRRLPAQAELGVRRAAEIAVVIVAEGGVPFERLDDRDVQLRERGVLRALT